MPADTVTATLDALRGLVVTGELRPGDRLIERQLAERLGVSRVPVREALRLLARDGLAEERPGGGMVVGRLAHEDVEALFEVRGALEDIACARIIAVRTDVGRLDALVAETRAAIAAGDTPGARALNAEFHAALFALAGPVLAAVQEPVAGRMRWLLSRHEDPEPMRRDHERIARALGAGDLRTARMHCREHLLDSRALVLATMDR